MSKEILPAVADIIKWWDYYYSCGAITDEEFYQITMNALVEAGKLMYHKKSLYEGCGILVDILSEIRRVQGVKIDWNIGEELFDAISDVEQRYHNWY